MIAQKPIKSYKEIAERCLNHYWGKGNMSGILFEVGWDNGSPAHKWALRWAKSNFKELKILTWRQIYKKYSVILRQE